MLQAPPRTMGFQESYHETPVHFLHRFSASLGARVWIKRDDWGDPILAGAKARKLSRLIPAIYSKGYRTVVGCGPSTSNSCRALAAACAATGLKAHLLLRGHRPENLTGNAQVAELAGASIEWMGDLSWPELEQTACRRASELGAYHLSPGATEPLGVRAMFDAGLEAIEQLKPLINEPYIIVHASATGGVSAGLRLAAGTASSCVAVHSVAVVSDIYADMEERYREICLAAKNDLGLNAVAPLTLSFEQVGNSYSAPPAAAIEAALNFTQAEGILADERYIGRALAYIRQIAVTTGLPIVLWHTGGGIGVFDK